MLINSTIILQNVRKIVLFSRESLKKNVKMLKKYQFSNIFENFEILTNFDTVLKIFMAF